MNRALQAFLLLLLAGGCVAALRQAELRTETALLREIALEAEAACAACDPRVVAWLRTVVDALLDETGEHMARLRRLEVLVTALESSARLETQVLPLDPAGEASSPP